MSKFEVIESLSRVGISRADAERLRKDSMILHRWYEYECGAYGCCIEYDEKKDCYYKTYGYDGCHPFRIKCADRETPARKRIAEVMEKYGELSYEINADPRGCALTILDKVGRRYVVYK